ncbi:hypothetical protein CRYUN_Cryun34aG0040600 [Craigia yunnanensis]
MFQNRTLNLKIRGLNERIVPTACLRVVLEQRADYRLGAGIPELYDASLILEPDLPFIKRIIWPILIPRTRLRDDFADSRAA